MIPSTPEGLKKMQELAERNIANGDWGEETTIPGIPGGTTPMTPEERASKSTVSNLLDKLGDRKVPKDK